MKTYSLATIIFAIGVLFTACSKDSEQAEEEQQMDEQEIVFSTVDFNDNPRLQYGHHVTKSGDKVFQISGFDNNYLSAFSLADNFDFGVHIPRLTNVASIESDGSGGVIVTGVKDNAFLVVFRVSASGTVIWERSYSYQGNIMNSPITQDFFYHTQTSDILNGKFILMHYNTMYVVNVADGTADFAIQHYSVYYWMQSVLDPTGFTVYGRSGASLLMARYNWTGDLQWSKEALDETAYTLVALDKPLVLNSNEVLMPYTRYQYSGVYGILKLNSQGEVLDNWSYNLSIARFPDISFNATAQNTFTLEKNTNNQLYINDKRLIAQDINNNPIPLVGAFSIDANGNVDGNSLTFSKSEVFYFDENYITVDGSGRKGTRTTNCDNYFGYEVTQLEKNTNVYPYNFVSTQLYDSEILSPIVAIHAALPFEFISSAAQTESDKDSKCTNLSF
ncbi:hypothetical protein [Altibacter lentus]|uniref:hypothetical protein n=1 Tax=Altibacter lentus TaxID=1223410 RepID=UPI00054CF7C0|nr:hypothetical protein [Altibacter lentus]